MGRPGYMNVKEAAQHYGVSRAKLHRLIRQGRLRTARDPRDERVTLLRVDEMDRLFRFSPADNGSGQQRSAQPSGIITQEWCDRVDALRKRVFGGRKLSEDSADIIRRERQKRTRQIERAAFGTAKKGRRKKA